MSAGVDRCLSLKTCREHDIDGREFAMLWNSMDQRRASRMRRLETRVHRKSAVVSTSGGYPGRVTNDDKTVIEVTVSF